MLHTTGLSWLGKLIDKDNEAWRKFSDKYPPAINYWLTKRFAAAGLDVATAKNLAGELTPDVVTHVLEKIETYHIKRHRKGGFRAWLERVSVNLAIDHLRQPNKQANGLTEALASRHGRDDLNDALSSVAPPYSDEYEFWEQAKRDIRKELSLEDVTIMDFLGWDDGRRLRRLPRTDGKPKTLADAEKEFGIRWETIAQKKSRALRACRKRAALLLAHRSNDSADSR